jgi:cytochrome P450
MAETPTIRAGVPGQPMAELPVDRVDPFDPPAGLEQLRAHDPITRLAYPDGHLGWLVTSFALGREILADNRFSRRRELQHIPRRFPLFNEMREPAPPGMFIHMDPPRHTRYRRLLTGQFTVRRMKLLEPRIAEIAAERLDAMERHGPPVDLVTEFALPIPSLVICELLGVPYADHGKFQHDAHVMLALDSTPEEVLASLISLYEYLHDLVVAKRADPADDLLSGLATDGELTDEELTGIAMLLLLAGHETTANMLGLGTFALLRHPDQLAAVRRDPALVDGAVEELLRYLSIVHIGPTRTALEDVEVGGRLVKSGETVAISIPAANRDPARFTHPGELDVTRPPAGHLAFGYGVHQCLGQQLARAEMRISYPALFNRFPTLRLAVPAEDVPLRSDMAIYGVHRLPVAW